MKLDSTSRNTSRPFGSSSVTSRRTLNVPENVRNCHLQACGEGGGGRDDASWLSFTAAKMRIQAPTHTPYCTKLALVHWICPLAALASLCVLRLDRYTPRRREHKRVYAPFRRLGRPPWCSRSMGWGGRGMLQPDSTPVGELPSNMI